MRAAITPGAFFLGMALICASLVEFQRFPLLEARLDASDLSAAGGWAVEKLAPEVAPSLLAAALAAVLGLALVLLRRHLLGGSLLAVSALAPLIVLTLAVLRLQGNDAAFYTCMGTHQPELPGVLISAQTLLLGLTAVIALAWLVVQHHERVQLGSASLLALGITLAMVGLTTGSAEHLVESIERQTRFWGESPELLRLRFLESALGIGLVAAGLGFAYYQRALSLPSTSALLVVALLMWLGSPPGASGAGPFRSFDLSNQPPGKFLMLIGACAFGGVALSFIRPLYCSRAVSLLVLLAGTIMSVPALAIAHDEKQEFHYSNVDAYEQMTSSPTNWCEPVEVRWLLRIRRDELWISGVNLPTEAVAVQVLREQQDRDRELRAQAGDPRGPEAMVVNFETDRTTSMKSVGIGLRALVTTGIDSIVVIAFQESPAGLWTRQVDHQHACGARVEFAANGRPLSDFADWPSLVKAAYLAKGKLRLNVPVSAAD